MVYVAGQFYLTSAYSIMYTQGQQRVGLHIDQGYLYSIRKYLVHSPPCGGRISADVIGGKNMKKEKI